jgi:hypothetical protein
MIFKINIDEFPELYESVYNWDAVCFGRQELISHILFTWIKTFRVLVLQILVREMLARH